eukprot:6175385-Pleurochrysis_carterae.AAC.7
MSANSRVRSSRSLRKRSNSVRVHRFIDIDGLWIYCLLYITDIFCALSAAPAAAPCAVATCTGCRPSTRGSHHGARDGLRSIMMLLLIVLHASANTAGQRNDAELYFPHLKSRMRDAQSATTLDESTATQNFRTKQQDQNLNNQKFRRLSHRRHGSHEHTGFNETSPMPTRAELDHLYQIAIDATAPIVNRVDTSCVLRIERVSPPRFCVAANALGATLQTPVCADAREDINKTRASPIGSLAFPQALLCNVVNSHAKLPSLGDAVAVVGFVTSADYLFLNFLSFVNRAAYCERTRRPFYLMLGTAVSQAELQEKPVSSLLPQNFASWGPQCLLDQPNTLNIFKTIALLALFEVSPRPPAVFYMDADTWFGDGGDGDPPLVTPEMYMALAPEAHLVRRHAVARVSAYVP